MYILGISAFYHDSAIAILRNGQVVFAAQEERFTRIKNDSAFPFFAIKSAFNFLNICAADISEIVFFEKPFLKFERILETSVAFSPWGYLQFIRSMPVWVKEKLFQKKILTRELVKLGFLESEANKILFSDHHLSHAASAFYPSPFESALVLTMDGVGEWATTTIYQGHKNNLVLKKEIQFPHSLGLLYSAFTYYCGFKVNSGEYKLMGLAPFGKPVFADKIKKFLIDIKTDGSFRLDMSYFNYCTGLTMTNKKFDRLFDFNLRSEDQEMRQVHMDIAASVQAVLEEVIIKIALDMKAKYKTENLCLAGGVALNCVANSALLKQKIFENIWIQPAAGDAGGALGAAFIAHSLRAEPLQKIKTQHDQMTGAYLGSSFSDIEIETQLIACGAHFEKKIEAEILQLTAIKLSENKAVGWFQGRMEFGPRSLGNRSILASPLLSDMQKNLNLKIKFRESFRPFAPSVTEEDCAEWFDFQGDSPYMLFVAQVKKNILPAVTHVDGSARLQTVSKKTNIKFHSLICEFKKITGVPVLVNTSFNIRGEPVVCSPTDAFRCFMGTDLDVLVIGNYFLKKEDQNKNFKKSYQDQFAKD